MKAKANSMNPDETGSSESILRFATSTILIYNYLVSLFYFFMIISRIVE